MDPKNLTNARERLEYQDQQGYRFLDCVVGNRLVAKRVRYPDGKLDTEYCVARGDKNGYCRQWASNGTLVYEANYKQGRLHGLIRQWSPNGVLLAEFRFDDGTGTDIWCGEDGQLAEERRFADGLLHGVERWWNDDQITIYIERYWFRGTLHGIYREWNAKGQLKRGFPHYFLKNERVPKRQYIKASQSDSNLPRFGDNDDCPQRKLPSEYLEARKAAVRKKS